MKSVVCGHQRCLGQIQEISDRPAPVDSQLYWGESPTNQHRKEILACE